MKKIISFVMVLFLAFALVACGGGSKLTGISIKVKTAQVQVGKTLQLEVAAQPAEAEVGTVTWSVNDPSKATISQTGLLTAGQTEGFVKVTAKASGFEASKSIRITAEANANYPDLGGYEIKIAQATIALGETNPFLTEETKGQYGYYAGLDREARQDAWTAVEDDFNCTISVVEYPANAAWGAARWNYIVEQARLDSPEYDFYTVPDAQIPTFANANAILDLTDWYYSYGNGLMHTINQTAGSYKGKLYSINTIDPSIYNILAYNYDLWAEINAAFPEIEEPAKIFNDGQWTYTKFAEYAAQVQTALNSLHPEEGYYAVSGWPTYYWVGMVDRSGTPVADTTAKEVNILTDAATKAAETLQTIFAGGAMDSAFSVDQGVTSWNSKKSLFNTGDLWFIGAETHTRWPEDVNFGYVPFPAPDGIAPNGKAYAEQYYVGTTAEACWVMAAGRDYSGYGEECTAENVYYAIMEYWYRSKTIYEKSEIFEEEGQMRATAESKFGESQESMKAFMAMCQNLKDGAFYDPMTSNSNTVCATSGSDLDIALRQFVLGTGAATWNDAVGAYQETLNKAITDAFG